MNVQTSWGILFCPWCGRDLMKLISSFPVEIAALAEQHELSLGPSFAGNVSHRAASADAASVENSKRDKV